MSEIHIIAILNPKKDKLDRFKELMKWMCETVHSKEDYTLRYLMTEKLEAGDEPQYIMVETYKDKAGADKHPTEQHFEELFAKFGDEDLFAKEPYIVQTKSVTGFDLDHKLV